MKDLFTADNYALRHTTGHNMRDPESLLTGAEINAGYDYANSHREYPSKEVYLLAVSGEMTSEDVSRIAPRVFNTGYSFPVVSIL
jgi:hypothetical protein